MLLLNPIQEHALLAVFQGRNTPDELHTVHGIGKTLYERQQIRDRLDAQSARRAAEQRS
jgi:hypothetical protein